MGLFGGSEEDGPAETLAANARGGSVTTEILTVTTKRLENDYLTVKPLYEVLEEDEQPQYVFRNTSKGIQRNGNSVGDGMTTETQSLCMITDQRVIFFANGNEAAAIPYAAVVDVRSKSAITKAKLTIVTDDAEYVMYLSQNKGEVDDAAAYILEQADDAGRSEGKPGVEEVPDFGALWDSADDAESLSIDQRLPDEDDDRGSYVTPDRIEKVVDILDGDEVVHYLTRGSTVDVEGSGAGGSLFGDDRSRKSGTRGYVRAVVTDRRVAVKVPQFLGNDERSVPYSNITSVDMDTGLVNKRLTLQTPGQTYHIEAHEPGKDELREITRFIRGKIDEANRSEPVQVESSEPDPLDQLEKLKTLHEQGAVSDDEFAEKKAELLDKI